MGVVKADELVTCEITIDIFCDMCGESVRSCEDIDYEYSCLQASWGYESSKDCTSWNYYFCEACSDKIMEFIKSKQ
jgi:hypothetical protein